MNYGIALNAKNKKSITRTKPKAKPPKNPTKIPAPIAFFLFTNAKTLPLITSIALMKIWISESSIRFVKISMKIKSRMGMKPRASPPRNSNVFEPRVTFGVATVSSVNGELIVKSIPAYKLLEMLSIQEVVVGR